ncbi:MAG TPA: hypothetical protein PKK99_00255 [Bacteroidia bacterium]|nr:hypothetical protein [Bacteroidia bacterium]HNP97449.1 hypothetical protein [Bacteroidia bacterium]
MLKTLLRIRVLQLSRSLSGLPLVYWLLIAGGIAYFSYGLYLKLSDIFYALISISVYILLVLYIHFARNDHRFLKSVAFHPLRIYLGEYFCLSMPFLVLLALNGWWWLILLCLCIWLTETILLFFLPVGNRGHLFLGSRLLIPLVPMSFFEWRSGLRKHGTFIFIVYAFAIGLSGLTLVSLFVLLLVSMSFSSFYSDGESAAVINAESLSPQQFLKHKLKTHVIACTMFFIPGLLIYLFRHPHDWIYVLLASLIFIINVSYFILIKYSFYRPDEKLAAGSVWVAILFASTLIPFLLPLPLMIIVRNYSVAKNNLKLYVDDTV